MRSWPQPLSEKLVEVNYFNQVSGSEILKNMIDFCDDATEIISYPGLFVSQPKPLIVV